MYHMFLTLVLEQLQLSFFVILHNITRPSSWFSSSFLVDDSILLRFTYCSLVIRIINVVSNSQSTQQCHVVFSSYGFGPTFLHSMSGRWNYELRPSVVHNLEIASLLLTKTYVVEEYSLFIIVLFLLWYCVAIWPHAIT